MESASRRGMCADAFRSRDHALTSLSFSIMTLAILAVSLLGYLAITF